MQNLCVWEIVSHYRIKFIQYVFVSKSLTSSWTLSTVKVEKGMMADLACVYERWNHSNPLSKPIWKPVLTRRSTSRNTESLVSVAESHHSASSQFSLVTSSVKRALYYHFILLGFTHVKVLLRDCISNTHTPTQSQRVWQTAADRTDPTIGIQKLSSCGRILTPWKTRK